MDTLRHVLASSSLAMVIFGCFGNCLSATVFLRRKTSINILLSALAFIDIGLLLFAIPVFILPTLDRWDGFITVQSVQAVTVKFLYPVNLMFQTWSIYTIVLITAERWLAICRPLHVRSLCTSRTAKWSLFFTALFSVLYNVIRFWEYSLNWTSAGGPFFFERNLRDPIEHPLYVLWYYSMLFLITHFVLPFGTIFTLNAVVCRRILRLRSIREQLTTKQLREHNTTTMLLLVTLTFALCNALPFLLNLAECIKRDLFESEGTAQMAYLLNDLANFLVILNRHITFLSLFSLLSLFFLSFPIFLTYFFLSFIPFLSFPFLFFSSLFFLFTLLPHLISKKSSIFIHLRPFSSTAWIFYTIFSAKFREGVATLFGLIKIIWSNWRIRSSSLANLVRLY